MELRDADGELTRLGSALSVGSLVVAILSGLLLLPLTAIALLSPMLCDAGCPPVRELAITAMLASPLLILIAAMSGVVAFKYVTWPLVGLTFAPALAAAAAFIVGLS